jgi:hypothetical protein
LLKVQLPALGFYLVISEPNDTLGGWIEGVTRRTRTPLGVLLDVRDEESWRLIVIDAVRRRAVARDLPGGAGNAANVEATVSVVLSAASALRDGLEVASAPVESVVQEPRPAASRDAANVEPSLPASPATGARQADVSEAPGPGRAQASGVVVRGALGTSAASFSADVRPSLGAATAVALTLPASIDVRLRVAHYFPATYTSALGDFDVTHTGASIMLGPRVQWGEWAGVVQAGVVAERLLRSNPKEGAAVTPTGDFSLMRFGATATVRGSYAVFGSFALLVGAGGSYFGRRVLFLARPAGASGTAESDEDRVELGRLWPGAVFAELAVEVASD